VGRVPLYLLDTDFPMNPEPVREITHRLYVDDRDNRLVQELLLGIGGVRVLDALGIEPAVWHMNEGHSAFLGLERMRRLVETGKELNQAREDVRSTTVFTTHTPVPAGNEVFPAELIGHYLNRDGEYKKIPADSVYRLARSNPDGSGEFNMTVLALNLSDYRNGVSRLHGEVARDMWKHLWPDRPVNEVPIGAITNGVHTHTWLTRQVLQLFDRTIGRDWRDHIVEPLFWEKIADIPDEELWQVHQELKNRFLETIRKRLVVQRERNGESRQAIIEALKFGDPEVLTIGFARRFAPYKRGTLLFRDREKLIKLVSDSRRPVQILFAGKAHPANEDGKALIRQIYAESRNPDFQSRIAFLENYDIRLARRMVSGVDIWLNTPRRPMEASGTSGMKAALNGALNLSISDGWWPEGYDGTNGWVIGEEKTYANTEEQDEADAKSLYKILGEEIIPLYYHRDDRGIPGKWMQRMKRSMATLIPRFNTYRMLESYVKNMYYPAAGKTGA
jgi:starch phosphorylase